MNLVNKNITQKKIENTYQIRVRYADTDKMAVVYNGNYARFFEIGRTELMRAYGLPYAEVEDRGFQLPLIDIYIKYVKPAKYDDLIDIYAILEMESSAVLKFNYELKVGNDIITTGWTRHIFINAETLKPTRPPKFFLELIS